MESDFDAREARRTAERAEAAPYVDYPPTPWWFLPTAGGWVAAYVALLGWRETHRLWMVVGVLALSALIGLFLGWYGRHHGAPPNLRRAPREFRPAWGVYAGGVALVLGSVTLVWQLVGHRPAVLAGFVSVVVALALYERAYAAAARRTRDRLA